MAEAWSETENMVISAAAKSTRFRMVLCLFWNYSLIHFRSTAIHEHRHTHTIVTRIILCTKLYVCALSSFKLADLFSLFTIWFRQSDFHRLTVADATVLTRVPIGVVGRIVKILNSRIHIFCCQTKKQHWLSFFFLRVETRTKLEFFKTFSSQSYFSLHFETMKKTRFKNIWQKTRSHRSQIRWRATGAVWIRRYIFYAPVLCIFLWNSTKHHVQRDPIENSIE